MLDQDKPRMIAALNELRLLKPNAPTFTKAHYDAWWHALREWALADFLRACAQLSKSCEFMPNPFHFEQLRRAAALQSGEAWAQVREILRAGGDAHADARVNSVVRMLGGWRQLGLTPIESMQFLERRFSEHFESLSDAEEIRAALPNLTPRQLPGIAKLLSAVKS